VGYRRQTVAAKVGNPKFSVKGCGEMRVIFCGIIRLPDTNSKPGPLPFTRWLDGFGRGTMGTKYFLLVDWFLYKA
jgi:hypothetical protein